MAHLGCPKPHILWQSVMLADSGIICVRLHHGSVVDPIRLSGDHARQRLKSFRKSRHFIAIPYGIRSFSRKPTLRRGFDFGMVAPDLMSPCDKADLLNTSVRGLAALSGQLPEF
jgi:hypothetical protein